MDKENRSPLLLAASRSGWRTVKTLVQLGADIYLKDSSQRNILHVIVTRGGNIEEFAETVRKVGISNLPDKCLFSLAVENAQDRLLTWSPNTYRDRFVLQDLVRPIDLARYTCTWIEKQTAVSSVSQIGT